MKNYKFPGENITLTAAAAITSGQPVLVGAIFGVAQQTVEAGERVVLVRRGIFDLPKTAAQAWTEGAKVYWDATNSVVTTTASGNTLIAPDRDAGEPQMMERHQLLMAYIAETWNTPMSDAHDCARFADGWYKRVHGESLMPFTYRKQARGLARLRQMGFADHVEYLASRLEAVRPSRADVGDIVAVAGDEDVPALGIVQGEGVYVLRPDGKAVVSRIFTLKAFRI